MKNAFLYPLILATVLTILLGCAELSKMFDRATEPRPELGDIPAIEIAKDVPAVVGNPGDIDKWIEIGEMVLYILLGGGAVGTAGVLANKRRKKKEG